MVYNKKHYEEHRNQILKKQKERYDKNRDEIKRKQRLWSAKNRDKINARSREYYHKTIEYQRERSRKKYRKRLEYYRTKHKENHREKKRIAIEYYSGGTNCCSCCGENLFAFLTLDHINNNGAKHRKEVGSGGHMADWLIKNNFPVGYQVLCYNCNCAKYFNGGCPHQIGGLIHMGSPSKVDSGVS